ncbi:MAG: DUF1572 domain-containing protein [Planctomycetota bacterium]|nr:MAG: DUF1572 domain-containing protein [Planctomycetota bacterium]
MSEGSDSVDGGGAAFLRAAIDRARRQKALAEAAMAQLDWSRIRRRLDEHTNSIAVIAKHLAGNLRSRWTNFMTSDGEKLGRDRDQEFVDDFPDREAMLATWEDGWRRMLDTLAALTPADLTKPVFIRGVEHTVAEAIVRSIEHNGYHIGQIVILARHWAGNDWKTLTIAPGGSAEYNRRHWGRSGRR